MTLKELLDKLDENTIFVDDFMDEIVKPNEFEDYMLSKRIELEEDNKIRVDWNTYSVYKLCDLKINDFFD